MQEVSSGAFWPPSQNRTPHLSALGWDRWDRWAACWTYIVLRSHVPLPLHLLLGLPAKSLSPIYNPGQAAPAVRCDGEAVAFVHGNAGTCRAVWSVGPSSRPHPTS